LRWVYAIAKIILTCLIIHIIETRKHHGTVEMLMESIDVRTLLFVIKHCSDLCLTRATARTWTQVKFTACS